MKQTFINLPSSITTSITHLLSETKNSWIQNAENLHTRYMERISDNEPYFQSENDTLAYLGLRTPATYAQIYSALLQVKEALPSFNPSALLDVGCGPGTGTWAAKEVWPSLSKAICIDSNKHILSLGETIQKEISLPLSITWKYTDILSEAADYHQADLIIIASVLNEMTPKQRKKLLSLLKSVTNPVIVILEPGNERGFHLIQDITQDMQRTIIAPYINNTFVPSSSYWIHFSQRFIRPEFQRQVRQHMRESPQMASDWEETKYTYVAVTKDKTAAKIWGRCIGPIIKQKGFLEVPILTEQNISFIKVLKRHKEQYAFAKNITWGDVIASKDSLIHNKDL